MKFDSKKEAEVYQKFRICEISGEITNLQRQVRFEIVPKQKNERAAYYVADFIYERKDGVKVIADAKSSYTRKNPLFKLKWKLMKHLYPDYQFEIIE
jgi:hypothetical protein